MKTVADIMSRSLVTVEPDDSLWLIKNIFDNVRFHHLLVVENKRLYGVISDRDLFKAMSPHIDTAAETPRDASTLHKKAHQIMTRKPVSIHMDATVDIARQILTRQMFSCLPVIDADGRPVGILTLRDLLKHAFIF